MTRFIIKLDRFVWKCKQILRDSEKGRIKFCEEGFYYSAGPFVPRSKKPIVRWDSIKEVLAGRQMDFEMCLIFITLDGLTKPVYDDYVGWKAFVQELPKRLPGFNMHNFKFAESHGVGPLPCWRLDQQLDNIIQGPQRDTYIWAKSGSLFAIIDNTGELRRLSQDEL